jgi:hypothetical protein
VPEGRPDDVTLWRWLERAAAEGRVCRKGAGHKNDPYRYWLPGHEARWAHNPPEFEELPPLEELLPPVRAPLPPIQEVLDILRARRLKG